MVEEEVEVEVAEVMVVEEEVAVVEGAIRIFTRILMRMLEEDMDMFISTWVDQAQQPVVDQVLPDPEHHPVPIPVPIPVPTLVRNRVRNPVDIRICMGLGCSTRGGRLEGVGCPRSRSTQ